MNLTELVQVNWLKQEITIGKLIDCSFKIKNIGWQEKYYN